MSFSSHVQVFTCILEGLDLQQTIAGEEAKLYFVVPAERFNMYKKQEFVMGKGQPVDSARIGALQARITQYALRLNPRRLKWALSPCWMRLPPGYQIVRQVRSSYGRL